MPYSTYHRTAGDALQSAKEARRGGGHVEIVRWYDKFLDPKDAGEPKGWIVGVDQAWGQDQIADCEAEARAS